MATTTVTLPTYSVFQNTPIYNVNGNIVFGLLKEPLLPDPTDQIYTVTQASENRLDLIADAFYGVSELWWVIAIVNNLVDVQASVDIGTKLRIPTKTRIANLNIIT